MDILATHKHARMSPQKLRPLARLLRGMSVLVAQQQLTFMPGKAPVLIAAVLKSAIANAVHNHDLKMEELVVREVRANAGLVMKRFMPVSRGMAHGILKRTSHITVVVGEKDPSKTRKVKSKKTKIEEMTVAEFAAREIKQAAETHEEVHDHEHEDGKKGKGEVDQREIGTRQDKQIGEAFQRTKMMQQGGDAKKTHRRKSIGGGK